MAQGNTYAARFQQQQQQQMWLRQQQEIERQVALQQQAAMQPAASKPHEKLKVPLPFNMTMPTDPMGDDADDDTCVVCLDRLREVRLAPCGHVALCRGCCNQVMSAASPCCPLCRVEISSTQLAAPA